MQPLHEEPDENEKLENDNQLRIPFPSKSPAISPRNSKRKRRLNTQELANKDYCTPQNQESMSHRPSSNQEEPTSASPHQNSATCRASNQDPTPQSESFQNKQSISVRKLQDQPQSHVLKAKASTGDITKKAKAKSHSKKKGSSGPSGSRVFIKCNDGKDRSISLAKIKRWKVSDLKQAFFSSESQNYVLNLRIIVQGRLLKDSDELGKTPLTAGSCIHVFITEKPVGSSRSTQLPTQGKENPLLNVFGMEIMKEKAISDETIVWKRFLFHSRYIMTCESDEQLAQDVLISRELYLLTNNPQILSSAQEFLQFDMKKAATPTLYPEEKKDKKTILEMANMILWLAFGFWLHYLSVLLILFYDFISSIWRPSNAFNKELVPMLLGICLRVSVFCVSYYFNGAFCFLIPWII